MSCPGVSQTKRVIHYEQASRSQFGWRPTTLKRATDPHVSSRWIVKKYAACGWAVVQVDLDGGMTPWYGVGGTMSI